MGVLLAVGVVGGCRPAEAVQRVEILQAAPLPPPPPALPAAYVPPDAVPLRSEALGAWARELPAEKRFREVEIAPSRAVTFAWQLGAVHKAREVPEEEDYPGNFAQVATLLVMRGEGANASATPIALGDLTGFVERFSLTYCRGRGYRLPENESWSIDEEPSIASSFSLGVMQGDSDFLLVRDGDTMHLLHRETSDGKCDDIQQGPLSSCEGLEWGRVADVHVPHGAALYERIEDDGKPLECIADRYGRALLPPAAP